MEPTSVEQIKKRNFSAGPAILPASVIKEAAAAAANWNNSGLSILEVSHRGKEFVAVLEEAESLTRELLGVSDDYAVLFLTGGASSQFYMTCMNILDQDQTGLYVNTGTWSTKAIKEAKHFGNIKELASSKDRNFTYIPKGYAIPEDGRFLHITSNNTIFGTEYHQLPETKLPIISDMSSNIFSRPIDIERYGLIYAGAQKNLGPAGVTLVIVRKDMLGQVKREIPTMLDYSTHINKNSAFNTPPVYPIFVSMLTMRWVKAQGGVAKMEEQNIAKAAILYNEIDRNPLFTGVVDQEDRSRMNVPFTINNPDLESKFMESATNAGCVGIKGHRSVGGFRASIYNAMPKEGVQTLVDVMSDFANQYA